MGKAKAESEKERTFEYTPTWVVASVCLIIVFISVCAERGLHKLGKVFKHHNQEPLFKAMQRLEEELMLLGFISLLLTIFEGMINKICIPRSMANIMVPCKLAHIDDSEPATHERRLSGGQSPRMCPPGNVPFLSIEALHELHIFIFILAVVYVISCASTTVLGGIRMREWRQWELSLRTEASTQQGARTHVIQIHEFMKRTGNYWRQFHIVIWTNAFFKQFYGSVTKSDYTAMRSGFIREHCPEYPEFNFHKYIVRTLEDGFRKIVGISWYLWMFVVIFMLVNIHGWHAYFWMQLIPPVMLLIIGAKLEYIITQLAKDVLHRAEAAQGTYVQVTDELFWFRRPHFVLYMIHFILFQNSFEIGFFIWIWLAYGFKSCIMDQPQFVIPRLVIGLLVQIICSYSTLPLYALVSQMGSHFKQTVFDECPHELIQMPSGGESSHSTSAQHSNPAFTSAHGSLSAQTSDPTDEEEEITHEHCLPKTSQNKQQ